MWPSQIYHVQQTAGNREQMHSMHCMCCLVKSSRRNYRSSVHSCSLHPVFWQCFATKAAHFSVLRMPATQLCSWLPESPARQYDKSRWPAVMQRCCNALTRRELAWPGPGKRVRSPGAGAAARSALARCHSRRAVPGKTARSPDSAPTRLHSTFCHKLFSLCLWFSSRGKNL